MYCWKCGQEITEGTSVCYACGADQKRTEPVSEAGKAMRVLYDRYGREQVLTNSLMLCNGLGDLMEDSQKLRGQLRIAMDAGLGRMVKNQLDSAGRPDYAFDCRVQNLLTEEAGLSEKIAKELAGYFDEMIGWREPAKPQPVPKPRPVPRPRLQPKKKKAGAVIAVILVLAAVLTGVYFVKNQSKEKPAKEEPPQVNRPIILSVTWSEERDEFAVQWDPNGSKGPWEVWFEYADGRLLAPNYKVHKRIADLETNSSGDTFYIYGRGDLIPGKTYELIIEDASKVPSKGYKATTPFNRGSSPLVLDSLRVSDIRIPAIKTMVEDLNAARKEADYDATRKKEKAAVSGLSAVMQMRDPSGTVLEEMLSLRLSYLLISPSGKNVSSEFMYMEDDDELRLGTASDIKRAVGNAIYDYYTYRIDEIETGTYTLEIYDWESKDFLGKTTFNITE